MAKSIRPPSPGRLRSKGRAVWTVEWDSGGSGAGAGEEIIYELDHLYWYPSVEGGLFGPFQTLAEAVNETQLNMVNEATTCIGSPALSTAEVAALLEVWEPGEYGLGVTIDGEWWLYDRPGHFQRVSGDNKEEEE
jgi:hypothetical protein